MVYQLVLVAGLLQFANAAPPPGRYDLYNFDGVKTGEITSAQTEKIEDGEKIICLSVETKIERSGFGDSYTFTEKDEVELDSKGLRFLRRETNDNGAKDTCLATRKKDELVLHYSRFGAKYSTSVPLKSFSATEFEIDLPTSPFRAIPSGKSKSMKVFYFDRMDVLQVSRNMSKVERLPYHDEDVDATVLTTIIKNKVIRSWFDVKTGGLLQETGDDYLMSRR